MHGIKPLILERAKRQFTDLRYGYLIVVPLITYSNFILIAYNFTDVKDWLSMEWFTVLFTAGMVALLVILGKTFRKQQLGTDEDLKYEQARQQAKTLRVLSESIYAINPTEELRDRIAYLRKIEQGENQRITPRIRRTINWSHVSSGLSVPFILASLVSFGMASDLQEPIPDMNALVLWVPGIILLIASAVLKPKSINPSGVKQ